jgi:hypothetical protein
MRNGDFGVEIIPSSGNVRELDSGHVLARPGTVYRIRLRNFGPLHAVAVVEIDGRTITAGGLVLRPWSVSDLERPIDDGETGRFTVAAEGDEKVFGADGGRDNEALGLIRASFRRELPTGRSRPQIPDEFPSLRRPSFDGSSYQRPSRIEALMSPGTLFEAPPTIERAAGTGLTGHSDQQFVPASLGPLEPEATVIQLRLVIGSEEAIADQPATRAVEDAAPARPAARP